MTLSHSKLSTLKGLTPHPPGLWDFFMKIQEYSCKNQGDFLIILNQIYRNL